MTPALCAYCGAGDAWDLTAYVEREREVEGRTVYNRRFRCACARGKQHRELGPKPRALYATAEGIGDAEADKFPPCPCPGGRCGRPGCLECGMASEQPAAQYTRARDAVALAVRDRDAELEDDLPTGAGQPVELVHPAVDESLERWIVRAHLSGLSPRWVYSRAWVGVPPVTFQNFLAVYVQVVIAYQRAGRVDLGVPLPGPLAETARALAEARTGLAELLSEQRAERAAARAELDAAEQLLAEFKAGWDGSTAGAVERVPLVEARSTAAAKLAALVGKHELAAPKLAAAMATVAKAQLDQRRHELHETSALIKWTMQHDAELED